MFCNSHRLSVSSDNDFRFWGEKAPPVIHTTLPSFSFYVNGSEIIGVVACLNVPVLLKIECKCACTEVAGFLLFLSECIHCLNYSLVHSDNLQFTVNLTRWMWLQILTNALVARAPATPTLPAQTPKAASPAPATTATRETDLLAMVSSRPLRDM